MLQLSVRPLDAASVAALGIFQARIDANQQFLAKVNAAKVEWQAKSNTKAGKALVIHLRNKLAEASVGIVRCVYCEDSAADEIEHLAPKAFFPERCFQYQNMAFACGPCNGPKGSIYAAWDGVNLQVMSRTRGAPIAPPPNGAPGLIDPRIEDPTGYIELDLGGVIPAGDRIEGTFNFVERPNLNNYDSARAKHTIELLRLNRVNRPGFIRRLAASL